MNKLFGDYHILAYLRAKARYAEGVKCCASKFSRCRSLHFGQTFFLISDKVFHY